MTRSCLAYMPLDTHPEAVSDAAVRAAVGLAAGLGYPLHVTTFAVDIPPMHSPLGGLLMNVKSMVRVAEERSRAECRRLGELVREAGGPMIASETEREIVLGGAPEAAAEEARTFDLAILPWTAESAAAQEMAQAVVFGSGRPTLVVPATVPAAAPDHIAIAWDGSRVAARALGDALAVLPAVSRITVLTVHDEKPLAGKGIATTLAKALERRGYVAEPRDITLEDRSIGDALQQAAAAAGASVLVMGGFGHSRFRDFVLGGATQGIFANLRLPVLISH